MKRFWGKREGFFGGSGFRAETGNSFWHKKEGNLRNFRPPQMPVEMEDFYVAANFQAPSAVQHPEKITKVTKVTNIFERKVKAIYYYNIITICNY
ncbi:MAG: hypothetical protein IJJ73_05750 [Bacteroidaceae bacterium]|nr:hypothetical protein [Bacteroidaceae bacterium]